MSERRRRRRFWEIDTEGLAESFKKNGYKFDVKREYKPPVWAFKIDQNFISNEVDKEKRYAGLVTENSVFLIDGHPKSKKTTFVAMVAAAHLNRKGKYQNVLCNMDANKHLLWFDTEQQIPEFNKLMKTILHVSGNEEHPDNFHSFNIKFLSSPEEKINYIIYQIERLIKRYTKKDGSIDERDKIGMIVIDQVADLVTGVNSSEDITDLFDFFDIILKKTGAIIAVIIHRNKNNNAPNGLLGQQLKKKVSTFMSVEKYFKNKTKYNYEPSDEEKEAAPSVAIFNEARNKSFIKRFYFNYDDRDFPVVLNPYNIL